MSVTAEQLKEMQEEIGKTFEVFKTENDKNLEEKSGEQTKKVEAIQDSLDAIQIKFKEMEAKNTDDEINDEICEKKEAMLHYMSKGEEAMPVEQKANLIRGVASFGGYLATSEFEASIIKKVTEIDPIRQYARVTTGSKQSLQLPKRETLLGGYWVGEQGDVTDDASTYGLLEIKAEAVAVDVPISSELLQDADVNMEMEISTDVSEAFGKTEGQAFYNGNGTEKPFGIMTNTLIERVTTAGALIVADDLLNIMYKLLGTYRDVAIWGMNRDVLRQIRSLKDLDDRYIFQTAQNGRVGFDLWGYPVIETPSGTTDTTTTGKEPVFFGDLFRGYRVYDRTGLSMLRDPYSAKKQRMVEFQFEKRCGGRVVLPEAIKILDIGS